MQDPNLKVTPTNTGRLDVKERVFDTSSGKWVNQTRSTTLEDKNEILEQKTQENLNNSGASDKSDKNSSKGKANKDFIEKEYFTLEGDVNLIAIKKTIKIKAGDTVSIRGIGKYLSGQYFVDSVTRTIDNSNGYTHSLTVQKNGFADSLKKGSPTNKAEEKADANTNQQERAQPVNKDVSEKSYVVIKGDTLWSIAVKMYGDGKQFTKISEANNIPENGFKHLMIGKELIIP